MADVFEVMHTARSIRRFERRPVPDELIRQILEAAIQAPNGTNMQSWRFVVVRDPELRRQLGEFYRQGFREVYPEEKVRDETDPGRKRVIRSADYLAEHMGDEPPVLLLCCIERGLNAMPAARTAGSSIYPAVQNVLLAARALGLGACLTTLHVRREEQVKSLLGLPENVDTYALIPIGYPASPFGPLRRRPVEEVTHYDRWSSNDAKG